MKIEKGNQMKRLLIVAVSAIALSGCFATNQQGGTLVGAGLGGLLGSQFGSGTGQLAATGLGVLAGGLLGNQIGQHMDQPQTIVYRGAAPRSNNQCSHIINEGVRSSCERGLADRRRELQKQSEQRAYQCSRYGKC